MEPFLSPLTADEEKECFDGIQKNDKNARDKLILHNMRLVAHVTKRYANTKEETEELIQIGAIGLIKATDSYHPNKGSRFSTYAIRCIENEILMYFRGRKRIQTEVSIFEPIGTDKEGNAILLFDILEAGEEDIVEEMEFHDRINALQENLHLILEPREYEVIVNRYGLFGKQEMTQREIASIYNISRSYVSRIEKKALDKLKTYLTKQV